MGNGDCHQQLTSSKVEVFIWTEVLHGSGDKAIWMNALTTRASLDQIFATGAMHCLNLSSVYFFEACSPENAWQ